MSEHRPRRSVTLPLPENTVSFWLPLLGAIATGFMAYSNLATKPELIRSQEETRAFAVAQDSNVLKTAQDYSNRNHDDMMIRFEQQRSEWKADVKGIATTQQFTLDGLRRIEERFKDIDPKRRHH